MGLNKLELGSGKRPHKGYLTVDIEPYSHADFIGDFRNMSFNNLDEIRSHHLFEHFGRDESMKILNLWNSWLKVGGTLIIETPDFQEICRNFDKDHYWMTRHTYGSQESDWAYHKDGWWQEKFEQVLPLHGFKIISFQKNCSRKILPNILVVAQKT
jgi:hypothetical protein